MTVNQMTLSIMTLSIMTLSIMTLSIMTLSIMTFSIITLSIMTLSITNYTTIMILGLIINIHFLRTFSTLTSESKVLVLYSVDTLSIIILKLLALLF
jgi:hypothetical protein